MSTQGVPVRSYRNVSRKRTLLGEGTQAQYGAVINSYQISPNLKPVKVINRPPVFPVRFTNNGKIMIATSENLLILYDYCGIESLVDVPTSTMFDVIFKPKFTVNLDIPVGREYRLHEDFVLCTEDDDYLITFFSYVPFNSTNIDLRRPNNETLEPCGEGFENFLIQVISIETAKVVHKLEFELDVMSICHCVYLRGRTFVVLSPQNQIIHIYNLRADGTLEEIINVGEYVEPISMRLLPDNILDDHYTSFRQMFLKAVYEIHKAEDTMALFFANYDIYREYKMCRVQMIDDSILLIRLSMKRRADRSHHQQSVMPFLFVFYDWKEAKILNIFSQESVELHGLYEHNLELFRYAFRTKNVRPPNNEFYAEMRKRMIPKSKKAKDEYIVKENQSLPYPMPLCPAFSALLDPTLFSFDEKIIERIERMRVPCETPIKTFNRLTGRPHLSLALDDLRNESHRMVMSVCRVLFHPFDLFVLAYSKTTFETGATFFLPDLKKDLGLPTVSSSKAQVSGALTSSSGHT